MGRLCAQWLCKNQTVLLKQIFILICAPMITMAAACKWHTVSSFHPEEIYHICSHLPKYVVNPHKTSKGARTYDLTLCPERGGDL